MAGQKSAFCRAAAVCVLGGLVGCLAPGARGATVLVAGSIGAAVEKAAPGDELLVPGPGVFHEHVVLEKRIRLLGTNSPVIDAGGVGTPLIVRAAGAEIVGIVARNGGTDTGEFDSGIMLVAPDVTVTDCQVEGGGFGIYIRGVDGCRVERNRVMGNLRVAASKRGNGIHLWKTKKNSIVANFISGTRDGIYFSYANENAIVSNRVEGTRFGIHYMYSNRNQLLQNTLTGNAVGAALMFARDCTVSGNHAFGNRRHGILLKQVEHTLLAGNQVSGQNRGFFVQQAVQDRFENNMIARNDIGLYLSNGSERNVFVGNAFVHNADQVWQPPDEVELGRLASNAFGEKGHGNFWSDYSGTDSNSDGIGDTPYHETDLFGYLVDRHPEARLFAISPAASLLRKGEELLPLLNTEGVTDLWPLQEPPAYARDALVQTQEMSQR